MGVTWMMNLVIGPLLGGVSIFIIYIVLVRRKK